MDRIKYWLELQRFKLIIIWKLIKRATRTILNLKQRR